MVIPSAIVKGSTKKLLSDYNVGYCTGGNDMKLFRFNNEKLEGVDEPETPYWFVMFTKKDNGKARILTEEEVEGIVYKPMSMNALMSNNNVVSETKTGKLTVPASKKKFEGWCEEANKKKKKEGKKRKRPTKDGKHGDKKKKKVKEVCVVSDDDEWMGMDGLRDISDYVSRDMKLALISILKRGDLEELFGDFYTDHWFPLITGCNALVEESHDVSTLIGRDGVRESMEDGFLCFVRMSGKTLECLPEKIKKGCESWVTGKPSPLCSFLTVGQGIRDLSTWKVALELANIPVGDGNPSPEYGFLAIMGMWIAYTLLYEIETLDGL